MPRFANKSIYSDEGLLIRNNLAVSRALEIRMTERAKIIVLAGEGRADTSIAEMSGISLPAAGKWRRRFIDNGIEGQSGLPRSGRPPAYEPAAARNAVLAKLEEPPPKGEAAAGREGQGLRA